MISKDEIRRIIRTDHHDPFSVLGIHQDDGAIAVRAFLPDAESAFVVEVKGTKKVEIPMEKLDEGGFFEARFPDRKSVFPYLLKRVERDGTTAVFEDSYRFLPTLTEFDLHLFGAGDHHHLYEKLGAHYSEIDGVGGVQFAVWAPNARSVSLVGNFNGWDRRRHAMRVLGSSGIWEIFVPGLAEGELYKYQVKTKDGRLMDKTDPFASAMETRPRTASRVDFLHHHRWQDKAWMEKRATEDIMARPVAVYEVHLGSWMRIPEDGNRWLSYKELAEKLIPYVLDRGFNYIELLPMLEHPLDASWGYQVTGYFAPTSRFGPPEDFMLFVDTCHQSGIGVILDWVPAHFPKDSHALGRFDGTALYEHADPRKGEHQDWGTLIFNYGRNEVRNFLLSSALFWLDKYHIDGIRIDAVASMLYLDYSRKEGEWVPNKYGGRENLEALDFLRHMNGVVHQYFPGVLMIAEESTAWPGVTNGLEFGGLGFDLKWNMGWMHDTLTYFSKDPIYRSHEQGKLTFALLYAFTERFMLPLSHDEVVHGKGSLLRKMPGDDWQKFANLRLLLSLMYSFPGKKLLFMGGELGQWDEWYHERSLDWHLLNYGPHKGIQRLVDDLNRLYRNEPAMHQVDFHYSGFEWIDFHDASNSVISFERKGADARERVIVVLNFTPVPREHYRVGVPGKATYEELFNSDSQFYNGSNIGNVGMIESEDVAMHGRPCSLPLVLPPLAALILKAQSRP